MMTRVVPRARVLGVLSALAVGYVVSVAGQALDPKTLYEPLQNRWATYAGDYTSRRYSALKQVNQSNVVSVWRSSGSRGSHRASRRRRVAGSAAAARLSPRLSADTGPVT